MISASTSNSGFGTGDCKPVVPRRLSSFYHQGNTVTAPRMDRPFSGVTTVADMVGTFWVIYTRPSREVKLTHELRAKGIDVFLPLVEKVYIYDRNGRSNKIRQKVPYLSRYIAICGNEEARYQAAISEHKTTVIDVRNQSRLVQDLKLIEAAIAFDPEAEVYSELPEGCRCRVKAGPWQGQIGILVKRRPAGQNFLVYTECFGQAGVPMDIDPAYLEPHESAA
jgi:hypothetical protein